MKKKLLTPDSGIKILIFGTDGMLGHKFYEVFKKNFSETYGTTRNSNSPIKDNKIITNVNVINFKKTLELIKEIKPEYIINCTGLIKQKLNRDNNSKILLVNAKFPIFLGRYAKKMKYKHIHFSTDCVYDGKKGNYSEKNKTNATDIYGKSKISAEKKLKNNSLVIRTSIIGHEKFKSTKSLLNWFLSQNKECVGFNKAFFSGVTTLELAKILLKIIQKNKFQKGIYNLSNSRISKFKLLNLIKDIYKKKIDIKINNEFYIDRSLSNKKFKEKFKEHISPWSIQIMEMYNNYKKKKKLHKYV